MAGHQGARAPLPKTGFSATARGFIALLLVLAFACRALIPAGYMPVADPKNPAIGITIAWCTPQGVVSAPLPTELQGIAGNQQNDDQQHDGHDPADHQNTPNLCAFALSLGGGGLAPDALLPVAILPWPAAPMLAVQELRRVTTQRLAAPPPPAQAPPITA